MIKKLIYYTVCIIIILSIAYVAYRRWRPKPVKYNLLIITLDTHRYDSLSSTGHPWLKTPYLDSLVNRGILFTNAYSSSCQTAPSHKSLFTGVSPVIHGIRSNADKVSDAFLIPSIAELLRKDNRYHTVAFYQGPFTAKDPYKVLKGFVGINPPPKGMTSMPLGGEFFTRDTLFTDAAIEELDKARTYSWFMWIHYWIPHSPFIVDECEKREYAVYFPPNEWWDACDTRFRNNVEGKKVLMNPIIKKLNENKYSRVGVKLVYMNDDEKNLLLLPFSEENKIYLRNLYYLQIPSLDKQIGRLFNYLKTNKLFDNTIIVLIADHAEALMDRNGEYGHGTSLYDNTLHVPFILVLPKSMGKKRIDALVRIIDVTPTLLDLLKINDPARDLREGMSLVPLIKGKGSGPQYVYSVLQDDIFSYRDLHWKYIWNLYGEGKDELYDIRQDTLELNNLADTYPDQVKKYFSILSNWNKQSSSSKIIDPEHLKKS